MGFSSLIRYNNEHVSRTMLHQKNEPWMIIIQWNANFGHFVPCEYWAELIINGNDSIIYGM